MNPKIGDLVKFTKPSGDSVGVVIEELRYSSKRSAWKTVELKKNAEVFLLEQTQILEVLHRGR